MTEYFSTEEKAKDRQEEVRVEMTNKICPIIKSNCLVNECMAYYEGSINDLRNTVQYGNSSVPFCLIVPCCCSSLITGAVELEQ